MNNVPTKKSLGQHWLYDDVTLNAMCDAANVEPGDLVLEVGPGLGTLTEKLLERGAEVWALEYDESLIPHLQKKFKGVDKTRLHIGHSDILQYNFNNPRPGYKVVANIPYYLTSNLLRIMSEAPNHFSKSALLVQKEVARRVCAGPGDMSLLSVSVQLYCNAELDEVVPARLFTPPPKVDSQILKLTHLERPRFDVDQKEFFKLVKAGFSERRKKLRSSLSSGLHIDKPEAEALLKKAKIDPNLRAQALSLDDWHKLYLAHKKLSKTP